MDEVQQQPDVPVEPPKPKPKHIPPGPWTAAAREKSLATRRKHRDDKIGRYLEALSRGLRIGEACKAAGFERETLQRLRKTDPTLLEREAQAEAAASEAVESALFEAAKGGNVPAAERWLANRSRERWKFGTETKVSVENKQVLEVEAGERLERISALLAKLEERKGLTAGVVDAEVVD